MIQSLAQKSNMSPEKYYEIGMQMAEQCFPEFQILMTARIDKYQSITYNAYR